MTQVTYCGGSADQCVTDMIVTIANVSMPAPGVVHHDYTDAPLSPQVNTVLKCQCCHEFFKLFNYFNSNSWDWYLVFIIGHFSANEYIL